MAKLNIKKKIILGSKSPRRIELMKLMGFTFKVKKLNINEDYPNSIPPAEVASYISQKKAEHYIIKKNEILICADTIVYHGNQIFEKPKSNKEAINMLQNLSNKRHYVITGVTFKHKDKLTSFSETSIVYFNKLKLEEIKYYIKHFNPLDKAGAYGIQDWIGLIGTKKISGSFYNIMGLPTSKVYNHLIKLA